METLVTEFPDDRLPENFPAYLMEVARRHARNYEEIPSVVAFWLPRLERAIPWIEEQERARRKPGSRFFSEQQVKWTFPLTHGNFTLTARMDRLEYHPEEGLSIIDYKTGAVPSDPDIESGKACQLTLAATLVEQGNLSAQWNALVSRLEYWQIKGSAEASKAKIIEDKGKVSLRHWIDTAREGAMALLLQFEHPEQAYYCIPPDEGSVKKDFIHLARVKEWSR
jgi:ATP-dependent helicase/nuclease subunit B